MAQQHQATRYTHGYSNYTIATHERRTADIEAAFLLQHIKASDHILDVGCGPGTITTGFAKYASQGKVVGLDMSASVLGRARTLAEENKIPSTGPGSVIFEEGNVLERLPYPDNTFDVVYSSQVLGHMVQPDLPRKALAEMRRVLKPGGILASRDQAYSQSFPKSLNLDRLWQERQRRVIRQGVADDVESTAAALPALYRSVGFDTNGGKVQVGAGTTVFSGSETRKWLAWRITGQLKPGDQFYKSWLDAGFTQDEIDETVVAVQEWADTEDAWAAALQCEMLAWK